MERPDSKPATVHLQQLTSVAPGTGAGSAGGIHSRWGISVTVLGAVSNGRPGRGGASGARVGECQVPAVCVLMVPLPLTRDHLEGERCKQRRSKQGLWRRDWGAAPGRQSWGVLCPPRAAHRWGACFGKRGPASASGATGIPSARQVAISQAC